MRCALSPRALPLALAVAAALFVAAPAALADSVDPAARATARKLGGEAVKLFESGDFAGALEKFNTADSLVPAPTLGLYAARCLVKLGRMVEASERYLEVTRMQLDRGALAVMRKAQADAVAERDRLLPTIPTLEIQLEGPQGDGVQVTVDGKPLLAGLVGEKRPVNPGKYTLLAKRTDTVVARDVEVGVGEATRVVLTLPPLPAPPAPRLPLLRKVGWAAIGVGGAGIVTGGVAGLIAISKGQSLLTACPLHVCPTGAALAQAGPYNAARVASTVGFIVGAVGLAAGIPIVIASPGVEYVYADGHVMPTAPPPSRDAPPRASVTPWITLGGAGVRGIF
jgi:hypothetical protein